MNIESLFDDVCELPIETLCNELILGTFYGINMRSYNCNQLDLVVWLVIA